MVQLVHTLKAHQDKVWSVSCHPTLPLLVSASTDKTSNIYKLSSRQNFPLISKLEDTHKRSIRSVAFKPPVGGVDSPAEGFLDLPALAAGSFDSTISIWGIDEPGNEYDDEDLVKNQQEILTGPGNEWNLMAIIEGHENEIKAVEWNYSGNLLASCSRDKTVWIWETDPETLEEFECISVLNDHQHDIKNVTWHPNQNMLASSSYDDTIRVYKQDVNDEDDWSCVGVLNGHDGTVWCSKFEDHNSPNFQKNRTRLVSASDDLSVRVWSSASEESGVTGSQLPSSIKHTSEMHWELEAVLPAVHKYPVYSVTWSKKTGKIASVGSDGKLVIYNESNGEWAIETVHESCHGVFEVNCVIWANLDDQTEVLVTAGDDGNIKVWQ